MMRRGRQAVREHMAVSYPVLRAPSGKPGDGPRAGSPGAGRCLTRRSVLRTVILAPALAAPLLHSASAAPSVVSKGKMVLAWHTNIATRWLDPLQHDGTASPDNFIMALHDALIKNFRERRYDCPALAERYDFAEDGKSAIFKLRPGIKFHDGSRITPEDVKWSFEHYRGAWGDVMHENTQGVEIIGDSAVRFDFKQSFLDFPILFGTANVCGAGWVVPAKYYEKVGQSGFMQKPVGAGPYKLVSQEPGVRLEFEAFDDYYRPVHVKQLTM